MNAFFGALILLAFCALTSSSQAQDIELSDYRWKNRLFVVFAEQETSPANQDLVQNIEDLREEFDDRDMVLISVFTTGTSTAQGHPISIDSANRLREEFEVNQKAFRVYLIGKDGGIKREGGEEIRVQDVFALIDTMPMRRSEMRRKSSDQD